MNNVDIRPPPSDWMYGFPKPYNPLPDEQIEDTLRRDGYPQREIDQGGARYVQFWETPQVDNISTTVVS